MSKTVKYVDCSPHWSFSMAYRVFEEMTSEDGWNYHITCEERVEIDGPTVEVPMVEAIKPMMLALQTYMPDCARKFTEDLSDKNFLQFVSDIVEMRVNKSDNVLLLERMIETIMAIQEANL